ncbi:YceH family protein [Thioalkalicoccus limnaeus]|uniref:YceH family protein n=1 Tax=Thioalkalicoccus limnaeus TaxID=120681 RepID=A0ABV4B9M3_9GAMM
MSETEATSVTLTQLEARILGCLIEKQRTTPDAYPLTLNALVLACNQKTSRHPVMNLEVREVGHAANVLRDRDLIDASYAGRAERYDQRLVSALRLDRREAAVMATLMLRGPQTASELRSNASRLAELPDLPALEYALRHLMSREPPLVIELPRSAGRREARYAHTLCGPIAAEDLADLAEPSPTPRQERLAQLEQEVARLRADLDALWELTGLGERREGP